MIYAHQNGLIQEQSLTLNLLLGPFEGGAERSRWQRLLPTHSPHLKPSDLEVIIMLGRRGPGSHGTGNHHPERDLIYGKSETRDQR